MQTNNILEISNLEMLNSFNYLAVVDKDYGLIQVDVDSLNPRGVDYSIVQENVLLSLLIHELDAKNLRIVVF
jgi:hypothetical protein